MLTNEDVVCGTSTTGTGTLSLAACPVPPGGLDPYAAFSGYGLGTSTGSPLSYTVVEYTDGTFTQPKQLETGWGLLLIGANLAATTLTRIPLHTETGLNSQPAVMAEGSFSTPATGITIGTAANTLVFVGPSAWNVMRGLNSYLVSLTGADGLGQVPWMAGSGTGLSYGCANQQLAYWSIYLGMYDVIKSCSVRVLTAMSSSPVSSSLALGLYAIGSTGLPGKLLINFGNVSAVNPLSAIATLTATAGAGVPIRPGHYILGILSQFSGGSGACTLRVANSCAPSPFGSSIVSGSGQFVGAAVLALLSGQTVLTDPALAPTSVSTAGPSSVLWCAFRNT